MEPPLPPGARWGGRLALLGGLALQVSAFLPFAVVPLLGHPLPVPGLLLHGGWVLICGLTVTSASLFGRARPGLGLLAGLGGGLLVAWDLAWILKRTGYTLGRLQLSLAELNGWLAQAGLPALTLYEPGTDPWSYPALGIWAGLGGAALAVLGAGLQGWSLSSPGVSAWSVWLGAPRCRGCGHRLDPWMAFCPGCGGRQRPGRACPGCSRWLPESFRCCPGCGRPSAEPASP